MNSAVVMGCSAGALSALSQVLPLLPAGFPLPIFVVVHLPPDKESVVPELLQAKCELNIKEGEDKEEILPGTVYIAPPDYHMQVERQNVISLSSEEPVLFSRPSIDILFETAADAYGKELIAIILTGANHDGAAGLKTVCDAGGVAIVQEPSSSYASAMPEAALKACPAALVLDLDGIVNYLKNAAAS